MIARANKLGALVTLLGVLMLAGVVGYFLFQMESADTIISTLKYGMMFLTSTLHFLALIYRGRSK